MSLVRFNPFNELENIIERYSDVTQNSLKNRGVADWAPKVDISEKKDSYHIKAELPGVSKDHVSVTLEQSVLTIKGEKHFEKETKEGKTHRVECSYGQFVRSFTLPESVQEDKVEAEYKDGVLNLTIPKAQENQPKPIEIKIK